MGKKACAIMILVFCLVLFGCAAKTSESSSTVSSSDSSSVSSASSSRVCSTPSSETSQPSSSGAAESLTSIGSSIVKTKNMSIDDYIETAYSVNIKTLDGDTYSYNVPNIKGIDSPYVREVNAELNKMIEEFKKYDEEKNNYSVGRAQEKNLIYLNDDVLSLVLHGRYNGGFRWYYVYNINVITGNKVTNSDILKSKNITEQEYLEKLKQVTKDHFLKYFPYDGMSSIYTKEQYNGYVNETISSQYCNLENPIFLDGDGNVNAVINYLSLAGPTINYDIVGIAVSGK